MTYAKGTEVTVQRSQQEIATTLHRYGVDTYSFGAAPGIAQVEFVAQGYPVRVTVPLPRKPAKEKGTNPATGRVVNLWTKWEQEVKEAWRALLLLIKANLEAVERGIVRIEQAFMAFLVAPDGRTVGDVVLPQYVESVASGRTLLAIEAGS
jgi:hypothetical protein